ncbi:MAG: hypothetical protein PF638_13695 [Candidatus Delongbacteria bacterium]|jgi:hypothetical protein|nr:hypothetical protein [Candidatus Delongbacteria bacterium]
MTYVDYFSDRELTPELLDAIKRYENFDQRLFFINFLLDSMTNAQVIERLDKAVADKKMIERDDESFFIEDYLEK